MDPERQHHNVTLAILTLAGAAFSLQQTMVFPALRTFQEAFGSSTAWTTWILTGFLVSGAVLTPILGRLGDQFGKERLLLISLGLFLAGCVGASFAWSLWSLIAFRVVSGAGGALFPLSFAIIRDEFPADKVKVGIGLLSAVWGVGGGFGIVLSGLIVDNFSWRYLFLLGSIPVALSLVLVHRYVPESPIRSPSKVDVPGALLLSGGLISLMLALTEGEDWGWGSPRLLGVLALAVVFFVLWGVVEARSSSPMVDLRMLAHRPILLTNIATLISGFALFSCFVLVPTFVETNSSQRLRLQRERDAWPGSTCSRARSRCSSPARSRARSGAATARSGRWRSACSSSASQRSSSRPCTPIPARSCSRARCSDSASAPPSPRWPG